MCVSSEYVKSRAKAIYEKLAFQIRYQSDPFSFSPFANYNNAVYDLISFSFTSYYKPS